MLQWGGVVRRRRRAMTKMSTHAQWIRMGVVYNSSVSIPSIFNVVHVALYKRKLKLCMVSRRRKMTQRVLGSEMCVNGRETNIDVICDETEVTAEWYRYLVLVYVHTYEGTCT